MLDAKTARLITESSSELKHEICIGELNKELEDAIKNAAMDNQTFTKVSVAKGLHRCLDAVAARLEQDGFRVSIENLNFMKVIHIDWSKEVVYNHIDNDKLQSGKNAFKQEYRD